MRGIILAAGRGSRLRELTNDVPKCMMKIDNQYLIEHIKKTYTEASIYDVIVVTGYRSDLIENLGFSTIFNNDWSKGNMVSSLYLALEKFVDDDLIVSYSDIIYGSKALELLRESESDIAITYDKQWLELWNKRSDDPLSDAENFKIDEKNILVQIGGSASSLNTIQGQFMGLIKISKKGAKQILDLISRRPAMRLKSDTTGLLAALIECGYEIEAINYASGWAEVDTPDDLQLAEKLYKAGQIGT